MCFNTVVLKDCWSQTMLRIKMCGWLKAHFIPKTLVFTWWIMMMHSKTSFSKKIKETGWLDVLSIFHPSFIHKSFPDRSPLRSIKHLQRSQGTALAVRGKADCRSAGTGCPNLGGAAVVGSLGKTWGSSLQGTWQTWKNSIKITE